VKKPKPPMIQCGYEPICPHGATKEHVVFSFMPNAHIKAADPRAGNWCPGPQK
jgi:hypothetical protein